MTNQDYLQPHYEVNQVIVNLAHKELVAKPLVDLFIKNLFYSPELHSKEGITEIAEYIDNLPDSLGEDPFPLFHSFAEGMYSREIHLPKGHIIVGKLHKHDSMVYMLKGKVLVVDEFGTKVVEAPAQFVSKAGIKRIGYVIEDVVWIDVHATDKTTVAEAEKEIFADSYDELETYQSMIESLGYTVDEVRKISEITEDMIDMPEGYNIEIKESPIEGKGAFATKDIRLNDCIGIARIDKNRTPLGRFANHSFTPNASCEIKNNSIYFVPVKNIFNGDEITVDYRQVRKSSEDLDSMINNKTNSGWSSCQV